MVLVLVAGDKVITKDLMKSCLSSEKSKVSSKGSVSVQNQPDAFG